MANTAAKGQNLTTPVHREKGLGVPPCDSFFSYARATKIKYDDEPLPDNKRLVKLDRLSINKKKYDGRLLYKVLSSTTDLRKFRALISRPVFGVENPRVRRVIGPWPFGRRNSVRVSEVCSINTQPDFITEQLSMLSVTLLYQKNNPRYY